MNTLMHSPPAEASRAMTFGLGALRWVVALFFLAMAAKNLAGDARMAADFERWGYPSWFRVLTAVMQIGGAILLLAPSVAFFGAGLLTVVLLGAVGTHLLNDPPASLIAPAVFIVLVVPILLTHRPPALR